ncbi:MAG: ABC transporter substrate-binding protein [Alistipes senegalensis]|nr:ABC transporter substrate-binding protein [Bacteroides cellulosilyticus]MCM1352550.1 ABC transporter substrate-binding protein [Alistipes senegalensis]
MMPIRYIFLTAVAVLLLAACGRWSEGVQGFTERVYEPRYASGFELSGAQGSDNRLLRVTTSWQGSAGSETKLLILRDGDEAPAGFDGQVLEGEARRIVCMSSSHVALLDALGEAARVVGVSGIDYISNPYVVEHRDKVFDVGYDGNVNYERLVALAPDLVLLYGVNGASGMEPKLRELGIPFVYVGEYLEESPLGKAEWLVVIGELVGKRSEAEAVFRAIPERYDALKGRVARATAARPRVMLNTPYNDVWFMAPPDSYMARLIADAGGEYVYRAKSSNRSLPVDLEQARLLADAADVWLNTGACSTLAELLRAVPKFADVACLRNGAVWNCDRRLNPAGGNDFWESGVVHPDLVLRDLVKIFHPELVPEPFVYYRQLE